MRLLCRTNLRLRLVVMWTRSHYIQRQLSRHFSFNEHEKWGKNHDFHDYQNAIAIFMKSEHYQSVTDNATRLFDLVKDIKWWLLNDSFFMGFLPSIRWFEVEHCFEERLFYYFLYLFLIFITQLYYFYFQFDSN